MTNNTQNILKCFPSLQTWKGFGRRNLTFTDVKKKRSSLIYRIKQKNFYFYSENTNYLHKFNWPCLEELVRCSAYNLIIILVILPLPSFKVCVLVVSCTFPFVAVEPYAAYKLKGSFVLELVERVARTPNNIPTTFSIACQDVYRIRTVSFIDYV